MNRKEILESAIKCVCQDRQDAYGNPESNFSKIAEYWNVYLGNRINQELDGEDIAVMMALLKIARKNTGKPKMDNYIDACGYLSIAGEMSER